MMNVGFDNDDASPTSSSPSSSPWIVSSLNNNKNGNDDENDDSSSPLPTNVPRIPTRLTLHLDINETILLGDDAGGDSRHDSIQKMIAKSAFCQIPMSSSSSSAPSSSSSSLSTKATPSNSNDSPIDEIQSSTRWEDTQQVIPTHWWDGQEFGKEVTIPPLYTGWEWPNNCCPYYRTAYKPKSKTFVEQHEGTIYRPILNACEEALAQSSLQSDHILPAFYETLYHLIMQHRHPEQLRNQQHHRKEEEHYQNDHDDNGERATSTTAATSSPPFTVVFRTFGSDIEEIAKLVTDFALGRHPDYPDVYYPPLCLSPGQLYQGRWKKQDVMVVENNDNGCIPTTAATTNVRYQLSELNSENQLVASTDEEILTLLQGMTVCGIRDDYPHWKAHEYCPTAGKPIWVPSYDAVTASSSSQTYNHHVLFDDNIHNLPHDGIACVRRQGTTIMDNGKVVFETVDGATMHDEYQGVHLIRVPTVEPVLNPNWFIEQIEIATNRLQRRLYDARTKNEGKTAPSS